MAGEFEKLAYEAALRGLDKQENLLEELRTRTGVLLAASSLAASFLGQQAFQNPSPRGLAITALVAFVATIYRRSTDVLPTTSNASGSRITRGSSGWPVLTRLPPAHW
jgi:hypothetical protein